MKSYLLNFLIFLNFLISYPALSGVHLVYKKDTLHLSKIERQLIYDILVKYAWPSGTAVSSALAKNDSLDQFNDLFKSEAFAESSFINQKIKQVLNNEDIQVLEIPSTVWNLHVMDFAIKNSENEELISSIQYMGSAPNRNSDFIDTFFALSEMLLAQIPKTLRQSINIPPKEDYLNAMKNLSLVLMNSIADENDFKRTEKKLIVNAIKKELSDPKNSLVMRLLEYETDQIYTNSAHLIRGTQGLNLTVGNTLLIAHDIPVILDDNQFISPSKNLSFGFNLFDGVLFDGYQAAIPASTFAHYRPKDNELVPPKDLIVYVLNLDKKKSYIYRENKRLIYIPDALLNEPVFGRGEMFHPRMLSRFVNTFDNILEKYTIPSLDSNFEPSTVYQGEELGLLRKMTSNNSHISELYNKKIYNFLHSLLPNAEANLLETIRSLEKNLPPISENMEPNVARRHEKIAEAKNTLNVLNDLKSKIKIDEDKLDLTIHKITGPEILVSKNDIFALLLHHYFSSKLLAENSVILFQNGKTMPEGSSQTETIKLYFEYFLWDVFGM